MDTQDAWKPTGAGVDDKLLSAKTCAATLEVAMSTWWARVCGSGLPCTPIRYGGRFPRFKRSQLAAWMASLEATPRTKQLALRRKRADGRQAEGRPCALWGLTAGLVVPPQSGPFPCPGTRACFPHEYVSEPA